mmetsp:Transcript_32282/g.100263  ORF Transcript_32282/g.100263 Transcript_32282/m.100263 type:complete len:102 (+) Transcript_32282:254-559(+)
MRALMDYRHQFAYRLAKLESLSRTEWPERLLAKIQGPASEVVLADPKDLSDPLSGIPRRSMAENPKNLEAVRPLHLVLATFKTSSQTEIPGGGEDIRTPED